MTKWSDRDIISKLLWAVRYEVGRYRQYGGVAQLARATGSYPVGHRFKSGLRYHRQCRLPYPDVVTAGFFVFCPVCTAGCTVVGRRTASGRAGSQRILPYGPLVKRPKTPPFHGGNSSSNLLRVTK